MRHHIVSGEQSLLCKEKHPPLQPRAALEQILPQSPNAKARVQVGVAEAIAQRPQGRGDTLAFFRAQFLDPTLKPGMKINPHSLPVNGLVRPDFRAPRTSDFTALYARSACSSVTPYS